MKIYIREKGSMSDFMRFSQETKDKLNKMIDSDSKKIIGKWNNHLQWTISVIDFSEIDIIEYSSFQGVNQFLCKN